MRRVGERATIRIGAVLCGTLLLAGACSGGDSADGGGDGTAGTPAPSTQAEAGGATTSSSAATTSTSLSTEDSIFNEKVKLSERFMEPVRAWRRAWTACLSEIAACDYDAQVAPFLSGVVKDNLRTTMNDLKAKGHNLRDSDPEGVRFVQYQVTRDSPLQVAIEVCVELDGHFVKIGADGTETVAGTIDPPVAQLTGVVLEEQPGGQLTIDQSVEYGPDQNIKAENCDQYEELQPSP